MGWQFVIDRDKRIVHVHSGGWYLDSFHMPRRCNSLSAFRSLFFSFYDLGKYKVESC